MQFEHVDTARIAQLWPVIAEILAPAVRADPSQTMEGLRNSLAEGSDRLLSISGPGHALMVIKVSSGLTCWIRYLAGNIEGGPKARVKTIRAAVQHLEAVAREAGCTEIQLCGRDWARILPDYEPCNGHPNGLRKGL